MIKSIPHISSAFHTIPKKTKVANLILVFEEGFVISSAISFCMFSKCSRNDNGAIVGLVKYLVSFYIKTFSSGLFSGQFFVSSDCTYRYCLSAELAVISAPVICVKVVFSIVEWCLRSTNRSASLIRNVPSA